jgi:peptide/nickel transport system permease protein
MAETPTQTAAEEKAPALMALETVPEPELGPGPETPTVEHVSPSRLAWRRFRKHKMAIVSIVVLALITLLCFFPGLVTDYGPNERLGLDERLQPPSAEHPMGTDRNQRDMLARVLQGGQVSLQVGVTVALVSGIIGSTVGALAAFYGRWLDTVLMRVTDLFLAIPALVALIVLTQLPQRQAWAETLIGPKGSVRAVITILALLGWMIVARLVRGAVLSLKEKEFVEAARASGGSGFRIIARHLVPNAFGTIVVAVTLGVAEAMLAESALSFLGFGIDAVFTPTWGNLLNDARSAPLTGDAYLVWFPGLAILITVLCVNYIGDGLRDALDPRQRG